jgi:hypothetical protein
MRIKQIITTAAAVTALAVPAGAFASTDSAMHDAATARTPAVVAGTHDASGPRTSPDTGVVVVDQAPAPAPASQVVVGTDGFDWASALVGGSIGAALLLSALLAWTSLTRRRRSAVA